MKIEYVSEGKQEFAPLAVDLQDMCCRFKSLGLFFRESVDLFFNAMNNRHRC